MPEAGEPDAEDTGARPAPHVVPLIDGWTLWRTICLRSTGFPIDMLESLAAHDAAAAIDGFLDCEAAWEDARERALQSFSNTVKTLEKDARKPYYRAMRHLTKGRTPDPIPEAPETASLFEALALAAERRDAARRRAEKSVAEARRSVSANLREVCTDPLFREAIIWQNRQVLHNSIDVLLRTPTGKRNTQARQHEQLVVNYLQRYCAKNETIGFFGPLAWGEWADEGPPLTLRLGPDLIAARKVHFEYWAIDALVDTLSKDSRLRIWLSPRLDPRLRIEGNALIGVLGKRRSIPSDTARVLAACDGETAAAEIAANVAADPECAEVTVDQVYGILDRATRSGVVSWTLDVPVAPNPERSLRKTLERVGDDPLRSHLTASLDGLEAAHGAVAAAAGDADALDRALGELEAQFTRLTGKSPVHHPGKVYAGRTLVYEDCRRQAEIDLGPEIRARIGPPLALILQSARWFSHTIAARFEDYLDKLYPELEARFAPQPVPFFSMGFLFDRRNPVIPGIVRTVVEDLTARWASILAFEPGTRRLQVSTERLRPHVSAAFTVPRPGWPGARHHSPDIMIAAEGPEAMRQGRFQCVLGEIHVTDTMVMRPLFRATHPRPEDLVVAYQHDVDHPRVHLVTPRKYVGHRKAWDPFLPGDFQLAWDSSPTWRSREKVLRICDLIVERSAGGFSVRTRDDTRCFPATVLFEPLLRRASLTEFRLLPQAGHTPRIILDGLVISRESWRFPCHELAFAYAKRGTERFIGARCWARVQGLPRWVFVRVPQEYKPVYVDLESPLSVEAMAKLVRRAIDAVGDKSELSLSEMLPTPRQCWLTDAQGNTYSSELRIVAVDPESWRPSGAEPSRGS